MRHHTVQRNRQADLLTKAIAESPYPVIVCGDFNDTPASYAYRKISRSLQDCFLQAGAGHGKAATNAGAIFYE